LTRDTQLTPSMMS